MLFFSLVTVFPTPRSADQFRLPQDGAQKCSGFIGNVFVKIKVYIYYEFYPCPRTIKSFPMTTLQRVNLGAPTR